MDSVWKRTYIGIAEVPKGTFWLSETGSVFEVTKVYPSIGGSTWPVFTLKHLRSGEDYDWNYNEMRANRLKQIDTEEVPLALLGAA